MIAVDTNVLLRYIVQDDPVQSALAERFLEHDLSPQVPGFVSLVAVCEIAWALERTYDLPREAIADAIMGLTKTPQLEIEAGDLVRVAAAQTRFTIADTIIHLVGQARNCTGTVTFDRNFARMDGVDLLAGRERGN